MPLWSPSRNIEYCSWVWLIFFPSLPLATYLEVVLEADEEGEGDCLQDALLV